MTASVETGADLVAPLASRRLARLRHLDLVGLVITLVTVVGAVLWSFPLYWGLVTTFKPEYEVVRPGVELWPQHFTLENYAHVLLQTKIGLWYVNSLITSGAVTIIVVMMAAGAGYAISQLEFPGRRFFWWMILASFMIPIPALIYGVVSGHGIWYPVNLLAGMMVPGVSMVVSRCQAPYQPSGVSCHHSNGCDCGAPVSQMP